MLIVEFGGVFSADDSDVSSVSSHQMTISLKVDIPVQATYKPIPKNLYKELKYYVEDLLCNNWTTNSEFPYSSLIAVLRKKIVPSGCVVTVLNANYRSLSSHSNPKNIDNFEGNQYFTRLDQSKAYHQLHMNPVKIESSQHF